MKLKRLEDAEKVLWHIINEWGYNSPKIELDRAYKEASQYFDTYGTDLLESDNNDET
jgi:hypothetical protein